MLESDYGDSEAASYSCCSVNSLTHCSPQLMMCDQGQSVCRRQPTQMIFIAYEGQASKLLV